MPIFSRSSQGLPRLIFSLFLILGPSLLLSACDSPIVGEFAWARTDDRDIPEPERTWLKPENYRLQRDFLYFYDYETIWWVYHVRDGSYEPEEGFVATLLSSGNAPSPVEVELRLTPVQMEGADGYIRQNYEPLKAGKYLLKISYKRNIVDVVEFEVVPPGGPAAMGSSNPRFDREDEMDADDDPEDPDKSFGPDNERETDEIIKYSS